MQSHISRLLLSPHGDGKASELRFGCAHTGHRKSVVRLYRNLNPVVRAGFTKFYLSMRASTREHSGCRTCGRDWRWPSCSWRAGGSKEPNHVGFTVISCKEPVPRSNGTSKQAKGPRLSLKLGVDGSRRSSGATGARESPLGTNSHWGRVLRMINHISRIVSSARCVGSWFYPRLEFPIPID